MLGDGLCEVTNDRGVGVEEIVTGHARLSGDTGGDEDNLGTLEARANIGLLVTLDLLGFVNGVIR